jgi:two-component system chemotaxis response regulator CheB
VVGTARDPFEAREKIVELNPDVLTLDIEMPRMDGLKFLTKLMPQFPLPVIMVSSLTRTGQQITMQCLEAGALDFVTKPVSATPDGLNSMLSLLRDKICDAARVDVSGFRNQRYIATTSTNRVQPKRHWAASTIVVVGASTGGTEALKVFLTKLPQEFPPVLAVQHMPAGYTTHFANRLNELCAMKVCEATDGMQIEAGCVYIAPGGRQMGLSLADERNRIRITEGEKVSGHKPSVDHLFLSLLPLNRRRVVALIMTGMGADGAMGMAKLHEAGAYTMAQDEASCVVFGMPKAAIMAGGVQVVCPLYQMADTLMDYLSEVDK